MYPRIDSEVSKKRNHLLKAPFCIHPATGMSHLSQASFRYLTGSGIFCGLGNICVPIDPTEVHNFDPNNVPTIHKLIEELDRIIVEDGAEHHSGTSPPANKFSEVVKNSIQGNVLQTGSRRAYARMSSCWIGTYRASCAKFELQTRVSFNTATKASC